MSLTPLAYAIAAALVAIFALGAVAEMLNLRALAPDVPDEFDGVYDADTYAKSQHYAQARTRFGWLGDGSALLILLVFWGLGGFGALDGFVRGFGKRSRPAFREWSLRGTAARSEQVRCSWNKSLCASYT